MRIVGLVVAMVLLLALAGEASAARTIADAEAEQVAYDGAYRRGAAAAIAREEADPPSVRGGELIEIAARAGYSRGYADGRLTQRERSGHAHVAHGLIWLAIMATNGALSAIGFASGANSVGDDPLPFIIGISAISFGLAAMAASVALLSAGGAEISDARDDREMMQEEDERPLRRRASLTLLPVLRSDGGGVSVMVRF